MSFSAELEPLMFFAIDHGVESVKASGGPLTPFLVRMRGESAEIIRFVAETLEEGIEYGRAAARASDASTTAVALVYDGYLTVDGERYDAVLTTIQGAGTQTSDIFAQPYRIIDGAFTEVGNPKHVAIDQSPLLG